MVFAFKGRGLKSFILRENIGRKKLLTFGISFKSTKEKEEIL